MRNRDGYALDVVTVVARYRGTETTGLAPAATAEVSLVRSTAHGLSTDAQPDA